MNRRRARRGFLPVLNVCESRTLLSGVNSYLDGNESSADATSITVGDINDDKTLDFAVGTSDGVVKLFAGGAPGAFTPLSTISVNPQGTPIAGVVAGNFDTKTATDPSDDLAVLSGNSVVLLKGDGSGTHFVPQAPIDLSASLTAGEKPVSLTTGSFYVTGRADLAVLLSDGKVILLQGEGGETFETKSPIAPFGMGTSFVGIAAGYFSGNDTLLDLAAVDSIGHYEFLQGNGAGGFTAGRQFRVASSSPVTGIGAGGKFGPSDLVIISGGTGTPASIVQELYAVHEDGTLWDVNYPGIVADHPFAYETQLGSPLAQGVGIVSDADLTPQFSEKEPLLIAAGVSTAQLIDQSGSLNGAGQNLILLNGPAITASVVDSFDSSNDQGAATAYADGTLRIGKGNGQGSYQYDQPSVQLPSPAVFLAAGSLNSGVDGKTDVVAGQADGTIDVFFGNGADGFVGQAPTLIDKVANLKSIAVGKFFGSTQVEIAALDSGGAIHLYKSNGDGTFTTLTTIPAVPPNPDPANQTATVATALTTGEFKPGEIGLAVTYALQFNSTPPSFLSNSQIVVYLSPDAGGATAYDLFNYEGGTTSVVAAAPIQKADQGFDDIAYVNGFGHLFVLKNDGQGKFALSSTSITFGPNAEDPSASLTPIQLVAGDFDQDGRIDLALLSDEPQTQVDLVLGNGNSDFIKSASLKVASGTAASLQVSDTSGSGKLDFTVVGAPVLTTFLASDALSKVASIVTPSTFEGDPQYSLAPNYTTPFSFVVKLDSAPLRGSFTYQTKDGTAKAGVDYQAESSSLSLSGNPDQSYTINVYVKPDYLIESSLRQFFLDLGNAQGVDLNGVSEGTQTMIDDDFEVVNLSYLPYAAPGDALPDSIPQITLQKAILVANAMNSAHHNPAGETITFNIPLVNGVVPGINAHDSVLPVITGKTHINGFSQPGTSAGSPLLVGSSLPGLSVIGLGDGFVFGRLDNGPAAQRTGAAGSVIEGLKINGFQYAGVVVDTGPPNLNDPNRAVIVRNNIIAANGAEGIGIRSGLAIIQGNTIRNNALDGIDVGTSGDVVASNKITDNGVGFIPGGIMTPGVDLKTLRQGISIGPAAWNVIVQGNTITGSRGNGITVLGPYASLIGNILDANLGDGIFTDALGVTIRGGKVTNSQYNGIEVTGDLPLEIPADLTSISDVALIQGNDDGIRVEGTNRVRIQGNGIQSNRESGIALVDTDGTSILNYVTGSPVGIRISSSSNTIIGSSAPALSIVDKDSIQGNEVGIWIEAGSTGNLVQNSNIFGTTDGIRIAGSARNRIVGGITSTENIIDGRLGTGISITGGSSGNLVLGNQISGMTGIDLNASGGNTIGEMFTSNPATYTNDANVLTLNEKIGILIENGADSNYILGNFVDSATASITVSASNRNQIFGNDLIGNNAIPHPNRTGIVLENGASGNIIGYADGAAGDSFHRGNIISNIGGQGILINQGAHDNGIYDTAINGNDVGIMLVGVSGNTIGALGNGEDPGRGFGNGVKNNGVGIELSAGSNSNLVGNNLVSGNQQANVSIDDSSLNAIYHNWIGTDATGLAAYPAQPGVGIRVRGQSKNNRIGDGTSFPGTGLGNVISGNGGDGILLAAPSSGNLVAGNIIGLDANGVNPVPNLNGIEIVGARFANQIGADMTRQRNLILGNRNQAILYSS